MSQLETPATPGDRLEHYRIDSVVTSSNVATVYRATDLRNNRDVAIKVPNPELENDATFRESFRREHETGLTLDHPGVMKIIPDLEQTKPYIVMEWFEGTPLRQILDRQKRLAPERAVRIAIAICNALEYVHSHGIVHGSLRPENVLIGAGDSIKLSELSGSAKTRARRLTLTRASQVSGASDYLSPEEVLGKHADAKSDVYALGIILYEMLTGRKPFSSEDPGDRLMNHPTPPREIDPAISPNLQEVIYRALERQPTKRYASAREFAHDLEHLDQVGVADRPELRDWKMHRSARLRKLFLYGAIALIPVLILLLLLHFSKH